MGIKGSLTERLGHEEAVRALLDIAKAVNFHFYVDCDWSDLLPNLIAQVNKINLEVMGARHVQDVLRTFIKKEISNE